VVYGLGLFISDRNNTEMINFCVSHIHKKGLDDSNTKKSKQDWNNKYIDQNNILVIGL